MLALVLAGSAHAGTIDYRELSSAPKGLEREHGIVFGLAWHDRNGEDVLLVRTARATPEQVSIVLDADHPDAGTETTVAPTPGTFSVTLWARRPGKPYRALQRFDVTVPDCYGRALEDAKDHAHTVADVDGDGIAEAALFWWNGCYRPGERLPAQLELVSGEKRYSMPGDGVRALWTLRGPQVIEPVPLPHADDALRASPFMGFANARWAEWAIAFVGKK